MSDRKAEQALLISAEANYLKLSDLERVVLAGLGDGSYGVSGASIRIDLSESHFYDLGAALWLIILLHRLKRQHNELQLVLPDPETGSAARNHWSFLFRWRFFETLAKCVGDPLTLLPTAQHKYLLTKDSGLREKYASAPGHTTLEGEHTFKALQSLLEITPLGLLPDPEDMSDQVGLFLRNCADRLVASSLAQYCDWPSETAREFADTVVSEGVRNAALHHGEGSFVLVSMRQDQKKLTLAIADNGQGIPNALRSHVRRLKPKTDAQLIEYFAGEEFIRESYSDAAVIAFIVQKGGVSSSPGRAGRGLHYLKRHVTSRGGELIIRSGEARVEFTPNERVTYSEHLPLSPGTLLRVRLPVANSKNAKAPDPSPDPPKSGRS